MAPLDSTKMDGKLSLSGDHQFINAGLAVSLSKCWLQRTGNWEKLFGRQELLEDKLPEAFYRGLSTAYLSGRAEIVYDTSSKSFSSLKVSECSSGDLVFYLDGASPESMEVCGRWFSGAIKANQKRSSCSRAEDREQVWSNGLLQHRTEEVDSTPISKQVTAIQTDFIVLEVNAWMLTTWTALLIAISIYPVTNSHLQLDYWFLTPFLLFIHCRFFYSIAWRLETLKYCFRGL